MRFTKKAETSMTVNYGLTLIRVLFMVFVSLSVVILITKFVGLNANIRDTEGNILLNRLYLSPSCLSYTDPATGRQYPGIIDASRFQSAVLVSCMYFGQENNHAAANLTLLYLGTGKINQTYYNEVGYILLYPRADQTGIGGRAGYRGPGSAMLFSDRRYVLVMDDNTLRRAVLTIELITPN
jgi:hypothetical protein